MKNKSRHYPAGTFIRETAYRWSVWLFHRKQTLLEIELIPCARITFQFRGCRTQLCASGSRRPEHTIRLVVRHLEAGMCANVHPCRYANQQDKLPHISCHPIRPVAHVCSCVLIATLFIKRTSSPLASHSASAAIAPSRCATSSTSALA